MISQLGVDMKTHGQSVTVTMLYPPLTARPDDIRDTLKSSGAVTAQIGCENGNFHQRDSSIMPRSKTPCSDCRHAASGRTPPIHLVNPETGAPNVYDIYGKAVCPTCGSVWHRNANHAVMVDCARKPPKRATVAKPAINRQPRRRA